MENNIMFLEDSKGRSVGTTSNIPASLLREGFIIVKDGQRYEVSKWLLEHKKGDSPKLKVILREVKVPWFAKNQDRQVLIGYLFVSPTLVFIVVGAYLYSYQPFTFWSLIGYCIREFVAFGLILTGAVLASQVKSGVGSERPTLLGTYLFLLFPVLGLLAATMWWSVSRPPTPPTIWPDDHVRYSEYLQARFQSLWPIVLGIIPWGVFLLNTVGLGAAAKFLEFAGKQGKSSKSNAT